MNQCARNKIFMQSIKQTLFIAGSVLTRRKVQTCDLPSQSRVLNIVENESSSKRKKQIVGRFRASLEETMQDK